MTNNNLQPINTAPKDGTEINVTWNPLDGQRTDKAKYNGEKWVTNVINSLSGFPFICRNIVGWQPLESNEYFQFVDEDGDDEYSASAGYGGWGPDE